LLDRSYDNVKINPATREMESMKGSLLVIAVGTALQHPSAGYRSNTHRKEVAELHLS
jgi:hypothetical protein